MEYLKEGYEGQLLETDEDISTILKKQIFYIENIMKEFRDDCVSIYVHHMYQRSMAEDYDVVSNRIRERWQQICAYHWTEHVQILNVFKIKACCFMGYVHSCRQDYDKALSCLIQGQKLIEVNALQYVIPEFYFHINMRMAECYREKHSFRKTVTSCLKKAEEILKETKETIQNRYDSSFKGGVYIDKLYLDLYFQKAYMAIDKCCTNEESDIMNLEDEAHRSFIDILSLLIKQDKAADRSILDGTDFDYDWLKKQWICFSTTRGEYFKNLYFIIEHEGTQRMKEFYQYLIRLSDIKPEVQNAEKSKISFQLELMKAAFHDFKAALEKDDKNTISMNGMAALLYYHSSHNKENSTLYTIVKQYCPQFLNMAAEPNINQNIEQMINQTVDNLLDAVLEIEKTNMFALNIKGAREYGKEFPSEIDNYPALRQSSLKKWLVRMKDLCREKKCTKEECVKEIQNIQTEDSCRGYYCRERDKFVDIEIALIHLYSLVNNFMKSAIIDFESDDWKDLEIGHYTKLSVLPKLLRKETGARMRMHNVHHLNDPLEGVILINHLKKELHKEYGDDSLIGKLWEMYDSDRNGAVRNSVYMGSFTCRLDQLSMWEQYGDHLKGVALQLNAKNFFDKEPEISLAELSTNGSYGKYKRENVRYPLYMVIYLPSGKSFSLKDLEESEKPENENSTEQTNKEGHEVSENKNTSARLEESWNKMQRKLIRDLCKLIRDIDESLEKIQAIYDLLGKETKSGIRQELCNAIMVILDLVRFLIKSDHYQDEREFRVIQYSSDPECEQEGMDVPSLYIPIEKELKFEKIYFGPLVTCFESKAAYPLNIKRDGQDNVIEVRKSEILFKEE